MDKLSLISGALFLAADIFAVAALAMPDWIVTEVAHQYSTQPNLSQVGGDTRLGLMQTCLTLHRRPTTCFTPSLRPSWLATLVCVFCGCICVTTTIILILARCAAATTHH